MLFLVSMLFCLPFSLLVFCGGKKDAKNSSQGKSKDAAQDKADSTVGGDDSTAQTGSVGGGTTTGATAKGGAKKDPAKEMAEKIKNGELLPPNDNETINDCESNWTDKKKK